MRESMDSAGRGELREPRRRGDFMFYAKVQTLLECVKESVLKSVYRESGENRAVSKGCFEQPLATFASGFAP